MNGTIGGIVVWIGCAMICASPVANLVQRILRRTRRFGFSLLDPAGCALMIVGNAFQREWWWVAAFSVLLPVNTWRYIDRRRKRLAPDDGGFLP